MLDSIFKTKKYVQQEKQAYKKAEELLEIFDLQDDAYSLASNLQLAYNNAREAARIASEYCRL